MNDFVNIDLISFIDIILLKYVHDYELNVKKYDIELMIACFMLKYVVYGYDNTDG